MLRNKFDRPHNCFSKNVIKAILMEMMQQIGKMMIQCSNPHVIYQKITVIWTKKIFLLEKILQIYRLEFGKRTLLKNGYAAVKSTREMMRILSVNQSDRCREIKMASIDAK